VVPGVAPEEHLLPGLDDPHLAVLGIGDHQGALQHAVGDVGGEDGLVAGRVPELPAGCELVLQHVQGVGGDVDPVGDETGHGIAPHVVRRRVSPYDGGPVERRTGRGAS
jgi:hypothetical protein